MCVSSHRNAAKTNSLKTVQCSDIVGVRSDKHLYIYMGTQRHTYMSTYRQRIISSKIISTIVHLQSGDICMAVNKVWHLFGGLNFGIFSLKSVTGDILQRPTVLFVCIFTYRNQFQTYQIKDFTFPNKPFVSVFQTHLVGTASPRMGTLLAPVEPIADQNLQIPFCRPALSLS